MPHVFVPKGDPSQAHHNHQQRTNRENRVIRKCGAQTQHIVLRKLRKRAFQNEPKFFRIHSEQRTSFPAFTFPPIYAQPLNPSITLPTCVSSDSCHTRRRPSRPNSNDTNAFGPPPSPDASNVSW